MHQRLCLRCVQPTAEPLATLLASRHSCIADSLQPVCVLWRWLQTASLPLDEVPEGVAEAEAAHIVLVVSDAAVLSVSRW